MTNSTAMRPDATTLFRPRALACLLLGAALAGGCATAPRSAPHALSAPEWTAPESAAGEAATPEPGDPGTLEAAMSWTPSPAPAPEPPMNFLRPYFWAAGVDGDIKAHGAKVDVDVSFSDILDSLDLGAMIAYEHRFKDQSALLVDVFYVGLEQDAKIANTEVDGKLKLSYVELSGAVPVDEDDGARTDVIVGMRGWYMKAEVDAGGFGDGDKTEQWLDPLVGARWIKPLNEAWSLALRGDVGGFGIGTASDLSWQAQAFTEWQFSESLALIFGYRYLSVDRDNGSGSAKTETDLALSGIGVGLDWRF